MMLFTPAEAAKGFMPLFDRCLAPGANALSLDYLQLKRPQPRPAQHDEAEPSDANADMEIDGAAQLGAASAVTRDALLETLLRSQPDATRRLDMHLSMDDEATAAAVRAAEALAAEMTADRTTAPSSHDTAAGGLAVGSVADGAIASTAAVGGDVVSSVAPSSAFAPVPGNTYTGYVRMYQTQRRFGFIKCDDGGEDLYVSADDVVDATGTGVRAFKVLVPGESVAFVVAANTPKSSRSLRAINVTGLNGQPVYVQNPAYRRTGMVRHFAPERQYGFVTPHTEAALGDVFFHTSNVVWSRSVDLAEQDVDVGIVLEYALLEPDGSASFDTSAKYKAGKPAGPSGGRRVGVCITAPGFTPLDPLEAAREGEGEAEAEVRRVKRQKLKEKRARDDGPRLVSGFVDDDALATW